MKTISTLLLLCCLIGGIPLRSLSQCGTGYNQVTLNWDYLDFFPYTGNYTSGNGYLPSNTYARTQNFAFGTNRVTIQHAYADNLGFGDNGTHTGSAGSYGSGDDIQFRGNGTVTITFEYEVQNLKFSMYDVDRNQRVRFNARNAANVAQNTDITRLGTAVTIVNDNSTTAGVDASSSVIANDQVNASFNVDIAGPVKSVTITISNTGTNSNPSENGDFWISDITACSIGDFPFNYYMVSRPFTGQPGYVLHALDKSVYMVNPANGVTKLLFTDPTNLGNDTYINSMGYDPYNKILYYVFSLTSNPAGNRRLRKYDFNTETMSDVFTNITTSLQIPTTTSNGVESGAAAFYNGSLYLGIEGYNGSKNSGRESVIWRIDFNAGNVPYRASQAWAIPSDNGAGRHLHDWSDFVINDGILYDFDGTGEPSNGEFDVYHSNMLTGETINFHHPAGGTWEPGQPGVGWNGIIYNMQSSSGVNPQVPYIVPYNLDGTVNTAQWFNMTSNPMFTPAIPSVGDGAEAFRPKSDFGDAPASYDPDPWAPATHERDPNLRLGPSFDNEWNLTSSALATADGADEDAISGTPDALNYNAWLTYGLAVRVFNNTGAPATLAGWLDYNYNGIFEQGEGVSVTVNSSASSQVVNLSWNNIWVGQTTNLRTFLRLRITRQANGMTTASMNGWFPDGEVEDYGVPMGITLPDDMQSFTVGKTHESAVKVNWDINVVEGIHNFEILRSTNNANWETVSTVPVKNGFGLQNYTYLDANPHLGTSYYRIRINYIRNNSNKFTDVKSVKLDQIKQFLKVLPNPATSHVALQLTAAAGGNASIQVYDKSGRQVIHVNRSVAAGFNKLELDNIGILAAGSYNVRVTVNGTVLRSQLIIGRH